MAVIVGGHLRSGTTLLRNLCNGHPDVAITMEFANFAPVGWPCRQYCHEMVRHWWRNRRRSFLVQGAEEQRWPLVLRSHLFVARYLYRIGRQATGPIDATMIETALRGEFPDAHVVGDKMPNYLFQLDELLRAGGLICIIIYRDCRDVTSSTLNMVRTEWRNLPFIGDYDTAEKIAMNWVRAIEVMEQHSDMIHRVRYEALVKTPEQEVSLLGDWLGADPGGFPIEMIHRASVGKHRTGLSDGELARVMDVAGPAMVRLGYE